jgi:hypothetical protein
MKMGNLNYGAADASSAGCPILVAGAPFKPGFGLIGDFDLFE